MESMLFNHCFIISTGRTDYIWTHNRNSFNVDLHGGLSQSCFHLPVFPLRHAFGGSIKSLHCLVS